MNKYESIAVMLQELASLKDLALIKRVLNAKLDSPYTLVWVAHDEDDEMNLEVEIPLNSTMYIRIIITECAKHFNMEG